MTEAVTNGNKRRFGTGLKIASTLAGAFILFLVGWIWRETVQDKLQSELDEWKFNVPLFREIPVDFDMIIRNLNVTLRTGESVEVAGPGREDRFQLQVSKVFRPNPNSPVHIVAFRFDGELGGNVFYGNFPTPVRIERGFCSGPIGAEQFDFFVCVEDVGINVVSLAIARRPTSSRSTGTLYYRNRGGLPPHERPAESILGEDPR